MSGADRRPKVELESHVLLVEDEAPLRRSLEKYLEGAGYTFDSCSNAREALIRAAKRHYDIVIAEYHLPDANGSVLLEQLMRVMPDVATIMISEFDLQAVAADLFRANVQWYLKKPFDLVDLETALSSARSKMDISIGNVQWKRELYIQGMPASIFK
jgi:DNA-binding NtrC family response regulator